VFVVGGAWDGNGAGAGAEAVAGAEMAGKGGAE